METNTELDLGYWFEPFDDSDAIGYRALDVHVYRTPTYRHFDPDRIAFPAVNAGGALTNTTVIHPWRGPERLRVGAGDIIIRDRWQKRVEAFTFGGEVMFRAFPDRTYCHFTSPVPFLRRSPEAIMNENGDGVIIAEEVEVLLARRHAAWHGDDAGFARRLAAVEPTALYAATLKSLEAYFTAMPGQRGRHYRRIVHDLHRGLTFLQAQGVDVERMPTLEMLL